MEVLISRFVDDPDMDLTHFTGTAMQISFYQRKTFRDFDHSRFMDRLRDHHIAVKSVHAPAADIYHQSENEFMTMLSTIRDTYGVRVVTLHPQRGHKDTAREHFRVLEEDLRRLDVILAYETFEREMMDRKWISQLDEMHEWFDLMDKPFLKVTYDFVHAQSHLNVEEVRDYHHHIEVIHFSDALRDKPIDPNEHHQHLPLGYGNYRVLEFLDLLCEIKYRNFLVLEYHAPYDALLKGDARAVADYLAGRHGPLENLLEERRLHRKTSDA